MSKKYTVHLDTDIGDDIDDAFCLALLLRSPEIELRSVSTVLNDTAGRADMVREMCEAAGQSPRIVAGARSVITRRPPKNALTRRPPHEARKTYDFQADMPATLATLAEVRRSYDVLLTIGPLTNLAMSLIADPDISRFPRYLAMAGEVQMFGHQEWNIVVDAEAAAVVLSSDLQIDFIPFKIGLDTKLNADEQTWLEKQTNPLAKVLNDYRAQFRRTHAGIQNMFDPMTVVALLHEDWFTWQRGRLTVETRGDVTNGQTIFRADENGPHRVAFAVDAEKAKRWMLDRLGE